MPGVAFFTLPPSNEPYPYILINASNYKRQLGTIRRIKKHIEMVIIDSGVEIFRNPNIKEYPGGPFEAVNRQSIIFDEVTRILGSSKVLVTIPDYPDDYNPKNLWVNSSVTNIERTCYNVIYALDEYPEVNWLIPIQGHNEKPESIRKSILLYEEAGILKRNKYFAVANLSNRRNKKLTIKTLQIAQEYLNTKHIHSFGIRMLEAVDAGTKKLINSFDTMAWTRPTKLAQLLIGAKKRWSCKNNWERTVYFYSWLLTITTKYGLKLDRIDVLHILRRLKKLLELKNNNKSTINSIIKVVMVSMPYIENPELLQHKEDIIETI